MCHTLIPTAAPVAGERDGTFHAVRDISGNRRLPGVSGKTASEDLEAAGVTDAVICIEEAESVGLIPYFKINESVLCGSNTPLCPFMALKQAEFA